MVAKSLELRGPSTYLRKCALVEGREVVVFAPTLVPNAIAIAVHFTGPGSGPEDLRTLRVVTSNPPTRKSPKLCQRPGTHR